MAYRVSILTSITLRFKNLNEPKREMLTKLHPVTAYQTVKTKNKGKKNFGVGREKEPLNLGDK